MGWPVVDACNGGVEFGEYTAVIRRFVAIFESLLFLFMRSCGVHFFVALCGRTIVIDVPIGTVPFIWFRIEWVDGVSYNRCY